MYDVNGCPPIEMSTRRSAVRSATVTTISSTRAWREAAAIRPAAARANEPAAGFNMERILPRTTGWRRRPAVGNGSAVRTLSLLGWIGEHDLARPESARGLGSLQKRRGKREVGRGTGRRRRFGLREAADAAQNANDVLGEQDACDRLVEFWPRESGKALFELLERSTAGEDVEVLLAADARDLPENFLAAGYSRQPVRETT